MSKLIKALRKSNLVELGMTGKFEVKDVQEKLIEHLKDLNLNDILVQ
jgi:hypothetical protein